MLLASTIEFCRWAKKTLFSKTENHIRPVSSWNCLTALFANYYKQPATIHIKWTTSKLQSTYERRRMEMIQKEQKALGPKQYNIDFYNAGLTLIM